VLQLSLQSLTLQIARSKASNQISEDIPQTRAALETPAAALRIACDLALRLSHPSSSPSCALQDDEAQSYALALCPSSYIIVVFFSCECRSSTSLYADCLGNISKHSLTSIIH